MDDLATAEGFLLETVGVGNILSILRKYDADTDEKRYWEVRDGYEKNNLGRYRLWWVSPDFEDTISIIFNKIIHKKHSGNYESIEEKKRTKERIYQYQKATYPKLRLRTL